MELWIAAKLSGGLGNRLFQTAAALGAAERSGHKAIFLLPRCGECPHGAFHTIFQMFPSIPVVEVATHWHTITEGNNHYEYYPIEVPSGHNVVILGYRQSHKYFPSYPISIDWDSVLKEKATQIQIETQLHTEEARANTVMLHVRLGDYKVLKHHQQELAEYYGEALQNARPGQRLHLFSDEPQLCQAIFEELALKLNLSFTVAKVRSDVESLYEMSLCQGGSITANSTFSWWGAYFAHQQNPHNKHWATYPERWGQGMPVPRDLIPEWGTVVSV